MPCPAGPRARGGRSPGIPASRGCRAAARVGSVESMMSVTRPGPRRHHDDLGREIHRLGDRVGDEADGLVGRAQSSSSCSLRWSRTISSSAPNGSSISSRSASKASARAIEARCCMPPDSCQGYFFSKPVRLTRSSVRSMRSRLLGLGVAHDLQRQGDVALDGAPRIERRRLEDIAVGALLARLFRRHAVDRDRARGRLLQIGDDAQQGGLAAARRADEGDEFALADRRGRHWTARCTGPSLVWKVRPELARRNDGRAGCVIVAAQPTSFAGRSGCAAYSSFEASILIRRVPETLARTAVKAEIFRCRVNESRPADLCAPEGTYAGKQGLSYFEGIAAETVGSTGICMHLLTIPPGGRAKAHLHEASRNGDLCALRRGAHLVRRPARGTCERQRPATCSTYRPACRILPANPS